MADRSPAPAFDSAALAGRNFLLRDFAFRSGETLPELRLHYRTLGKATREGRPARGDHSGEIDNAVLILHATNQSGAQFLHPEFSGELFGPGQPLDASRHFIILPDNIGHGGSSKPSDGLRARFPRYGYLDMIEAQRRLLIEAFGISHLRLILGTSMGGMHTWLWGERYPQMMDALFPIACLPAKISGANREWRRAIANSIRSDPEWKHGDYQEQPKALQSAIAMLGNASSDANDVLYAIESSRDYDPGPELESIVAPLFAVNSGDDGINPPEEGILQREIARVKRGRAAIVVSNDAIGHGGHSLARVWKRQLLELLRESSIGSTPAERD